MSVFGLPYDASEREVHILFSACTGYVRCIVVPGKGAQRPYAFVQFASPSDASAAIEARRGTSWEEGAQPVSIEHAKRDIPDKFGSRQAAAPITPLAPLIIQPPAPVLPPAKRPRLEAPVGFATPAYEQEATEPGPKTLHIGGLPRGILQEDLDAFLSANFRSSCIGGRLSDAGGKDSGKGGSFGRAFVGFVSHQAAVEAQVLLEGFDWDGAVLRVEWARSEYTPLAARRGNLAPPSSSPVLATHHSTHRSPPIQSSPPPLQAPVPHPEQGNAVCTLHFTNLPFVSEAEFNQYLSITFPDLVVRARFVHTKDGRPPVAWVLFIDEVAAASVAQSHQMFDWYESQVQVQFARTELDLTKVRD